MATNKLQKELYQLMVGSISIQSLGAEERTKLQNQILMLPEAQMKKIVKILKKEHAEMKKLFAEEKLEEKQLEMLEEAINQSRDASKNLSKIYLSAQESVDRKESAHATKDLLDQLDKLV